jgi:hypothetical protein
VRSKNVSCLLSEDGLIICFGVRNTDDVLCTKISNGILITTHSCLGRIWSLDAASFAFSHQRSTIGPLATQASKSLTSSKRINTSLRHPTRICSFFLTQPLSHTSPLKSRTNHTKEISLKEVERGLNIARPLISYCASWHKSLI